MENQSEQNPAEPHPDPVEPHAKTPDMMLGAAITIGAAFLSLVISLAAKTPIPFIVTVGLYLLGIAWFFYRQRKYISIGMILMVVVPAVVIGGCMWVTGKL